MICEQNELIADLHIHSRFSRATSKEISPLTLYRWAQLKGVGLLGTGDCTHPQWFEELMDGFMEKAEGLWTLRNDLKAQADGLVPSACRSDVLFVFQTEISTISKKDGRTRKVHHLILLPDPSSVERLISALERVGNLRSDGRPILGLDSRDLLEITLEACEDAIFVPAHVWTPWFSVFGSRSGFEDLEECYEDLLPHVAALETGLSSDPEMNWRWSRLDGFQLVSNSDAHSPSKIGREANVLRGVNSFRDLRLALRTGRGLIGTLEFFPEEGKYHLDGHRKCGVQWDPLDTIRARGICPKCGRQVTVGVMHRVEELCDRPRGLKPSNAKPFERLLPLEEVLAQVLGCGPGSKAVKSHYWKLLDRWGPELFILRELPLSDLERHGPPLLAEAIRRMRQGRVITDAGFDGQYGKILLFAPNERSSLLGQARFFPVTEVADSAQIGDQKAAAWGLKDSCAAEGPHAFREQAPLKPKGGSSSTQPRLSPAQRRAIEHGTDPLLIIAGPGTGKTFVLTHRIARFIKEGLADPKEVLALTFTTRAAREMTGRLVSILGEDPGSKGAFVGTFHAFGYGIIRDHWEKLGFHVEPFLMDEESRYRLIKRILAEEFSGIRSGGTSSLMERISEWKRETAMRPVREESLIAQVGGIYNCWLRRLGALDYDDLLIAPLEAFRRDPALKAEIQQRARFVFVDEFQDLSPLQTEFLHELLSERGHLTVIGDPDQSIYGFRGATPGCFIELIRSVEELAQVVLEENYRSSGTVVEAASAVIRRNPSPFPRALRATMERGGHIEIRAFQCEREEARFIAEEIEAILGGTSHHAQRSSRSKAQQLEGLSFGDIAVLYRMHAVGAALEERLTETGIPFKRYGTEPLRARPAVGMVFALLRWIADPGRDQDLLWVLSSPRLGVSRQLQSSLYQVAKLKAGHLWEWLKEYWETLPVKGPSRSRLNRSMELLKGLLCRAKGESIESTLNIVLHLMGENPYDQAGESLLSWMLRSARQWNGDLIGFLDHWSLMEEADLYDPRAESVTMLTVHASKGLEFPVVFLVGCEEGIFPPDQQSNKADLEEERRLFYVALTRAQRALYISCARNRMIHGHRVSREPSRFISEIPQSLCRTGPPPPQRPTRTARQLKLF